MNYEERIKQIEEHFDNISMEQFEINLERAGMGIIKPLSIKGMKLMDLEECGYSNSLNPYWEIEKLLDYQLFEGDNEAAA
jgi:hypothetical protein